jgi:hypothetical protein
MPLQFSRLIRPFTLSIAAALVLSACGGGGDDAPTAVVGAQTGVFVDSAVEGLSYETSSGVKGTTDAQGRFTYNEGDTVTFKIGGVTLGSGKAAGTVTPSHISEGGEDSNKFTNLLVLLQSLDTDGDPANGITLPASLDGTKIAKVAERLNDDPADFTDDSKNGELKEASPQKAIRKREDARKHYEDTQAKASTFLDDAAGVWSGYEWNDEAYEALLRLTPSGRYVLSVKNTGSMEAGPEAGLEVGSLSVDATTGQVTTSDIKTDTNGDAGGWSKLGEGRSVKIAFETQDDGSKDTSRLQITLKVTGQSDMTFILQRVRQLRNSVAGAWSTSPDLRANAGMVVFGNRYDFVAPQAAGTCTEPGTQSGFYYTAQSSTFGLDQPEVPTTTLNFGKHYQSIGECSVLGNVGGAGLPFQLTEDGSVLTLFNPVSGEVKLKLYRIKRDKDVLEENNVAEEV